MKLSAVVITYNEEKRIEDCLRSVSFADEIVVVDSYSSDRTKELATKFPVRFFERAFDHYANQKNYALSQANGNWILLVDADERVPEDLAAEVRSIATTAAERAYAIKRETYFFGKRLRFSGTRDDWPVRLFPKDALHFEQPVHEKVVTELPVSKLKHVMLHYTTRDWAHYKQKLPQYIRLEVETMRRKGGKISWFDLCFRPAARFIRLYFFMLGFLDALGGLQFASCSAYYEYLKCSQFLKVKAK